jgi:hypothetical protein
MIAYFLEKLGSLLERSEQYRREAYLASSAYLADLVRRMRSLEANGFPTEANFGLNA